MFDNKKTPKWMILKEKKLWFFENVFNGYPCKNVTKYFCIFSFFIFFILRKKLAFIAARGRPPPSP